MKNIKVYLISISVIIFTILFLNIIINYFISLEHPGFLKVVGEIDTWINFNGTVISSIIGGLVAGFIAFKISKIQIDNERETNYKLRNLQLKQDLIFETNKNLLGLNSYVLDNIQFIHKYLRNILLQAKSYRNIVLKARVPTDDIILKMKDFLESNFTEYDKYCTEFYNTNLEINRIYSTYTIVLLDYKTQIEDIFFSLGSIGSMLPVFKRAYKDIQSAYEGKSNIPDTDYNSWIDSFNELVNKSNITYSKVILLNTDIQNSFEFLFNAKIKEPDLTDNYFKRI